MNFKLTKPCSNCPFRTDCPKRWLGAERAASIAAVLQNDGTFSCHKTTTTDDEGEACTSAESSQCAGALLVLRKDTESGGLAANRVFRMALHLGEIKLAPSAEKAVFNTFKEFINHHKF